MYTTRTEWGNAVLRWNRIWWPRLIKTTVYISDFCQCKYWSYYRSESNYWRRGARQINEADVFLSSLRRGALPPKAETRSVAALHSRICRTRGCEVPDAVLHSTVKAGWISAFVPYEITENPRRSSDGRPPFKVRHLRSPIKSRTRERRRCLR